MKYAALLTFLLFTALVHSQATDVLQKLKMFRLLTDDFVQNLQTPDSNCYFNYSYAFTSIDSAYTQQANYDPSKPLGAQWELLNENGMPASEKNKRLFAKAHPLPNHPSKVMVNDSTLDNDMEGKYMIVLFHLMPETVPARYEYLKDCIGKAYISMTGGKLEKVIYTSKKETTYQGFKVPSVHMEVTFVYDSPKKMYRFLREQTDMTLNMNGISATTLEIREYTGPGK